MKRYFITIALSAFYLSFLLPSVNAQILFDENGRWEENFDYDFNWEQGEPPFGEFVSGGAWKCGPGDYGNQLIEEAKNPLSEGKRGFRHWQGDGTNNNSGGLGLRFDKKQKEFWIRFYHRYEEGFQWSINSNSGKRVPHYDKILYIWTSTSGNATFAHISTDGWRIPTQSPSGVRAAGADRGWHWTMGGDQSHGEFVAHEYYFKMDTDGTNGVGMYWQNGELLIESHDINYSTLDINNVQDRDLKAREGWTNFLVGSNQNTPDNGRCMYVDYDDIVIYNSTPPNTDEHGNPFIGPLGWEGAPQFSAGLMTSETDVINHRAIEFHGYGQNGVEPYTYQWDFGNGDSSTEQNPIYSYNLQGQYEVTLTVTDANENIAQHSKTITVSESPLFSHLEPAPPLSGIATGGEEYIIEEGGNTYKLHLWHSNTPPERSDLNVYASGEIEYLIIGGGGGGGWHYGGGGGGAGGLLTGIMNVDTGSYPIVAGKGGLGGKSNTEAGEDGRGEDGEDSSAFGMTAQGGGGGGAYSLPGKDGGSGGGASGSYSGNPGDYGGVGNIGQGYDGGSRDGTSHNSGGAGGGGAGGPGQNALSNNIGYNGGLGVTVWGMDLAGGGAGGRPAHSIGGLATHGGGQPRQGGTGSGRLPIHLSGGGGYGGGQSVNYPEDSSAGADGMVAIRYLLDEESVLEPTTAFAHLTWNESTEEDLAGYRVYYGTSPRVGDSPDNCNLCGYDQMVDVNRTTSKNFSNLTGGRTYYFSVTAYDTLGNESPFSQEVIKETPLISADLNGDTRVHSIDFAIMMSNWNSTERPNADINRDGVVNSVDFAILMSQWTG